MEREDRKSNSNVVCKHTCRNFTVFPGAKANIYEPSERPLWYSAYKKLENEKN